MQSRRIESLYLLVRIDPHSSILRLIERLTFLLLLTLFAFPHIVVAEPSVDVVNSNAGNYTHPVAPIKELPLSIRSNCYNYVVYRLGNIPPTAVIKANLTTHGQIGYMVSNGIDHYVVVEEDYGDTLLISDTNFGQQQKSTRIILRSAFVGFFQL